MAQLRLGRVSELAFIPFYHAFEEESIPLKIMWVSGMPGDLKRMFMEGKLDITPISSIEYACNADNCLIIPGLSICSDGPAANVYLFSKIPITELDGKTICLNNSSETPVVLLKILMEHYFHVHAHYLTIKLNFDEMLTKGDAALMIGDGAINAYQHVVENNEKLCVIDLGEVWKQFTGQKMVYFLWVMSKDFAEKHNEEAAAVCKLLNESKLKLSEQNFSNAMLEKAQALSGLSVDIIKDYFSNICYEFDEDCQHALQTFFDYAYKSGLIEERVKLNIWDKIK